MAFSYRPLWHTLIDRDMTPRELRDGAGLSQETMSRMKQGQGGSLETHIGTVAQEISKL